MTTHLVAAADALPIPLGRLLRAAAPRILAIETAAVALGANVWVFDVERRAQVADPAAADGIVVEEHAEGTTQLLATAWASLVGSAVAFSAPRPVGGYHLCLVDGDELHCIPIVPLR